MEDLKDTADKNNISIMQKSYVKAGSTYFSQSKTLFSTIPEDINIKELRLVDIENVIPHVLRKRTNKNSQLARYPIKEITLLSSIYVLSARKRKIEIEDIEMKKRKIEYMGKTNSIKDKIQVFARQGAKEKETEERFNGFFSQYPWKNL